MDDLVYLYTFFIRLISLMHLFHSSFRMGFNRIKKSLRKKEIQVILIFLIVYSILIETEEKKIREKKNIGRIEL